MSFRETRFCLLQRFFGMGFEDVEIPNPFLAEKRAGQTAVVPNKWRKRRMSARKLVYILPNLP